jgi:teichuronic acid biosynthesis glycosyltransferase TuaC
MSVLFICSGNKNDGKPGILVANQAASLSKIGVAVQIETIKGKGTLGYVNAIPQLVKKIRNFPEKTMHAHYSLSAFAATFALILSFRKKKLVVSLMGSDAKMKGWKRFLTRFFARYYWSSTIVKSQQMAVDLNLKNYIVLPNGVDLSLFESKLPRNRNHLLFPADPNRESKNFALAKEVVEKVKAEIPDLTFEIAFDLSHQEILEKIQKTSCVLSTSLWEGSPNIIKEALAANTPIVATNVGDVQWLLEHVTGCYCTSFELGEMVQSVLNALEFSRDFGHTNGKSKIKELGLDAQSVAYQLKNVYER